MTPIFMKLVLVLSSDSTPYHVWFCFPSIGDITSFATEEELRKLGFGYRAKSIVTAALQLVEQVELSRNQNLVVENFGQISHNEMLKNSKNQHLTRTCRNFGTEVPALSTGSQALGRPQLTTSGT